MRRRSDRILGTRKEIKGEGTCEGVIEGWGERVVGSGSESATRPLRERAGALVDRAKLIAWLEIAAATFAGGAVEAAEQALVGGLPHDWPGWRRVLIVAAVAGATAVWHRYRPVPASSDAKSLQTGASS